MTGTIYIGNDEDWLAMDLVAGTSYRFDTISTFDHVFLSLFNSAGSYVSGTGNPDNLGYTPTTSGRYYLSVMGLEASDVGAYIVKMLPGVPDDYTSSTQTTGRLTAGGQATGVFTMPNDDDWFGVDLVAGTAYQFDVTSTVSQVVLSLYGSTGSYISNSAGVNKTSFTPTVSGRYYLSTMNLFSDQTGSYTVKVSGPAAVADDYPASTSTTGILAVGGEAMGTIGTGGDKDWFAMNLVAGTTYQFDGYDAASGGGTLPSIYLSLYNSSGTLISGTAAADKTTYTPTVSGRYYLSAEGLLTTHTGTYSLKATALASDDYANSTATTGTLAIGGQATGTIGSASDKDWFAVDLVAGTTYQFDGLDAASGGGTLPAIYLSVYNSSGNQVSGAATADKTTYTPSVSGRYYLSAEGLVSTDRGTYTVKATAQATDDYAASTATTGLLVIGGQATGVIGNTSDDDWFAVNLVAGTSYEFQGLGARDNGGTVPGLNLTLLDPSGNYIPTLGGLEKAEYTATTSGRYFLSAKGFGGTGTYTLKATAVSVDDYLGSTQTTGVLTIGGAEVKGTIGVARDKDWFAVDLVAGQTYRFDAFDAESGGGTLPGAYLDLYTSTGGSLYIGASDKTGYTPIASGRFYLSVGGTFETQTGTYSVKASMAPVDDYKGTTDTTGVLAVGGETKATIDAIGDADWFAMDLVAGTTYQFDGLGASGGGGTLPRVYLSFFNASGTYISNTSTVDQATVTVNTSGRYYISAQSLNNTDLGTYTLKAKALSADDYLANMNTTGVVVVGGPQVTGTIGIINDSDWFAVDLVAGQTYQFNGFDAAVGGGTLPSIMLSLYSTLGNYLQVGGLDKMSYTAIVTGRYYVSIGSFVESQTGSYSLSAATVTDDYSGIKDTTGRLAIGGETTGKIDISNDRDWFAVDLVGGATYQFNGFDAASGGGTLPSIFLAMYDTVGGYIVNTGALDKLSFTPTTSGRYFVGVENINDVGVGTYTLKASSSQASFPTLSVSAPTAAEGGGNLVYTVSLSSASTVPVTFVAKTAGGTATAGTDYTTVEKTITIAVGATSVTIEVPIRNDNKAEADETVTLTLSQVTGALLPGNAVDGVVSATGTIRNDDFGAAFTLDAYRALNPDLVSVFGNNDGAYVSHYISNGRAEGRASAGFDAEAYAALNPDLFNAFGLNEDALASHYRTNGKAEGRLAEGFDAEAYAALNPDLFGAFGTNHTALISHYISNGRAEGRVATGFDAEAYAALNPDLFNAFGLNATSLITHYIQSGRAEGRVATGFDAEAYAALNPDLFNAFGLNHSTLISHYISNGRGEGRPAFAVDTGGSGQAMLDLVGVTETGF
ncbi:Calx-beta domain-containing protein [Niveispirillum sp. KHB5.9]|uniref:Calx-beta domain-containing protein n=1 Tax=Niveispirillum sp. KHB5.9 TaxID=3400269 RepID=UPI003A83FF4C